MSLTPGPWIAECVGDSGGENTTDIYEITNGFVRIAEFLTEDDARLIAEAPAMLDLLKRAVDEMAERSLLFEQINAVIARIEGKS